MLKTSIRLIHRYTSAWLPLLLILLWFVGMAGTLAAQIPPFEAPDELAHFLYIHNLQHTGELPTLFEDRDAIFASQATHRHHPPLYYLLGAALTGDGIRESQLAPYRRANPLAAIGTVTDNNQQTFLTPIEGENDAFRAMLFRLRWVSVLLGAVTLALIYRIGGQASRKRWIGLLAMALVAVIPTFLFISAAINNDNFVTFFYTAGLCWLVDRWRAGQNALTWNQTLIIGLILSGMALTKVNGLSLFGLVYAGLIFGVWRGRWTWRSALRAMVVSGMMALILAGWWYARNIDLYGDPLALDATAKIWGRGDAAHANEILGVWWSFWAVLGQFNIRMDGWIYSYATVLTVGGLIGLLRIPRAKRGILLLLGGTVALVIASLIVATTRVNISQGRLLFPMIGAFAVLVMWGWSRWIRRPVLAVLLLVPLGIAAGQIPATLDAAYPTLVALDAPPEHYSPIEAQAGALYVYGYTVDSTRLVPDDLLTLQAYFRVTHPPTDDLALSVVALDLARNAVRGTAIVTPGNIATHELPAGETVYRVEIHLRLDQPDGPLPPTQIHLEWKWLHVESVGDGVVDIIYALEWQDADDNALSIVTPAVTWVDPRYEPPPLETVSGQDFGGDALRLESYGVDHTRLSAGETLTVCFVWRPLRAFSPDWRVTVQLTDLSGALITNADGVPAGYPSGAWVPGVAFADCRTLTLPDDLPAGHYALWVGWYNDQTRLSLPGSETNLLYLADVVVR